MNEPNWAKVLSYFYKEQKPVDYPLKDSLPKTHDIVTELELERDEIVELLHDLWTIGLLEHYQYGGTDEQKKRIEFTISKKGFDVAHERELREEQHEISETSAKLAGYLVLGVVLQALTVIVQMSNWQSVFLSFIVVVLMGAVWWEIR